MIPLSWTLGWMTAGGWRPGAAALIGGTTPGRSRSRDGDAFGSPSRPGGCPSPKALPNQPEPDTEQPELKPGDKLPSTREIAESYGVHMNTASRAMSLLHDRDLIIGQPGRGTYVADPSTK